MNNQESNDFVNSYENYLHRVTGINGAQAFSFMMKLLAEKDSLLKRLYESQGSVQARMQAAFMEGMVTILEMGKKQMDKEGPNPFPPVNLN